MKQEDRNRSSQRIQLYLSPEHGCSYLAERTARTLFVDPSAHLTPHLYRNLLELGFRRSGDHVYRPECPGCGACIPVRIPVNEFTPRRNQRRCWRQNESITQVLGLNPVLDMEHFQLYQRYTGTRHPTGGMADADQQRYLDFLTTRWGDTRFFEFRQQERLMAVAVTDRVPDGLSAVSTFFDPDMASRSPGMFAILWQIAEARRQGLDWLYLGYWIRNCEKMNYKDQYRPMEAWDGRLWQRLEHPDTPNNPR